MSNFKSLYLILLCSLLVTGCATSRGVLDIPEVSSATPLQGTALKIVSVTDQRDFQIKPRQADIPSLKGSEINDFKITSRAIARKRNAYGKALGDILLPEGKTVMGLVESRLSKGFNDNGYRVLSVGDDGYELATPVTVDIEKFWGWFSPGFWSLGINFQTLIVVTAPLGGFEDGVEMGSKVQERFQVASGKNWLTVIQMSLNQLNRDIQSRVSVSKRSVTKKPSKSGLES